MKSILVVEDDIALGESVSDILTGEGWDVTLISNGRDGLKAFEAGKFNVVLTDFRLPEMGGMELMEVIRERSSGVPVIMMTGHGTSSLAIEAARKGAFDYLIKPFKTRDLIDAISKARSSAKITGRKVAFEANEDIGNHHVIIGNSPGMQQVYREIGRVADKNIAVLIQGETGTGKDLIARALFHHGGHRDKIFVAVNCTAIPDNLLESELFGHEKGAFTGAATRRIGRFEQADGGTLFLDEIGDMTPETQVKMLRVLQEKTIRRVGGDHEIPVDVRIIAATHQNLEKAIAEGRFREDLYYRINTSIIDLPSLREREGDIELLIQHFVNMYCREFGAEPPNLGENVLQILKNHPWPGNVRELENVTRKMIIRSNGYPLSEEDVQQFLTRSAKIEPSVGNEPGLKKRIREMLVLARKGEIQHPYAALVEELERELFDQTLELCHANQSSASRLLGVSRASFREKMEKFGMLPAKKSSGSMLFVTNESSHH